MHTTVGNIAQILDERQFFIISKLERVSQEIFNGAICA